MAAKNGEKHHLSKLTADGVREIRRRRAAGETIDSIWLSFPNVASPSTITAVLNGRTWRHVR
ncbi:hypothetical protein ACFY7C_19225 [Streptomyces sp. NPDC012769]|uniref:hypothetical protein n=1 Tax=Streptomyces sp. NPDC012769 TaxID=3364848 RepID=UPI003686A921